MKYFTQEWAEGLEEDEAARVRGRYWARIDAIRAELSPEVRRLALEVNIHDGLVRRIEFDRRSRRLTLALRCGDLQVGYSDVDLIYDDVDVDRLDRAALQAAAEDPRSEALYDEVDVRPPSRFVHLILFGCNVAPFRPYREVEIDFSTLDVATVPQPDRLLRDIGPRYHEEAVGV